MPTSGTITPTSRSDLKPKEKRSLFELRIKLEDAIRSNRLLRQPTFHNHHQDRSSSRRHCRSLSSDSLSSLSESSKKRSDLLSISLWGVPLLPSLKNPSTDVLLLCFLRSVEFKYLEALQLLQRTLIWRQHFQADLLLSQPQQQQGEEGDLVPQLASVSVIDGVDRQGRPVVYNDYGVLREAEAYERAVRTEEGRERFMRWRVREMERAVARLSFKPGGVAAMIYVTDLKHSMDHNSKELRAATNEALELIHDYYPDLIAKHILINVSFRHYAYHAVFSHSFSQRSKSKYIFARPSRVTETLLKFIAPEKLPVRYGGLKRDDDGEFSIEDAPSELIVKGGTKGLVEIPIVEPGVTVVWDITAVGWEVNLKEEFIPDDECSYKVLIRKEKKLEESVRNSFYISEPGKVVLTIENRSFKRKWIFYRFISKPTIPVYRS